MQEMVEAELTDKDLVELGLVKMRMRKLVLSALSTWPAGAVEAQSFASAAISPPTVPPAPAQTAQPIHAVISSETQPTSAKTKAAEARARAAKALHVLNANV